MEENKTYRLLSLDEEECHLIIIKSNGLIWFYKQYEDDKGVCQDSLWLEDGFKEVKIIMKSGSSSDKRYCFVYLTDECGSHSIMEVVNKIPILDEYQPNHYKMVYKKISLDTNNTSETNDVIYRLFIRKKKNYALYSLRKGFIFGPYNYKNIDMHRNGVILDNRIAVENCGITFDLTNYIYDGGVYVRKDKKEYLLFLDQKEKMFVPMEKDYSDDNYMIAETEYDIFKYNKTTGECRCQPIGSYLGE